MSSPKPKSKPVENPTTVQTPVQSGNAAEDAAAQAKKEELKETTSTSSILTSGAGVLTDEELKKNLLGATTYKNKAKSLG